MAIIKIKLVNGGDRYINSTEYVGVCNLGVLTAKCAHQHADSTYMIRGIARLWSLKEFATESAIIETSSARLNGESHREYFHLLLHVWFQNCNSSLERGIRPIFKREVEVNQSVRGKPDFYKTDSLNRGMLGTVISVVSRLGLDLPEIMVIRDAYEYVIQADELLPSDVILRRTMLNTLSRGLSILAPVPRSDNARKNATLVLSRLISSRKGECSKEQVRLPPKLRHLSQTSSFCAKLLLSKNDGVTGSEVGQRGLLLNMNYLMQRLLQLACVSKAAPIGESEFSNGINIVENGISMYPDIVGSMGDGTHFILDVKHKIFIDDNNHTNNKLSKKSDDLNAELNSTVMKREDFYQIISYATTHHRTSKPALYGLIGIWKPADFLASEYINLRVEPSMIKYRRSDGETGVIVISRIPLNFARILHEIGKNENIATVLEKVSTPLFSKLEADRQKGENPSRKAS